MRRWYATALVKPDKTLTDIQLLQARSPKAAAQLAGSIRSAGDPFYKQVKVRLVGHRSYLDSNLFSSWNYSVRTYDVYFTTKLESISIHKD